MTKLSIITTIFVIAIIVTASAYFLSAGYSKQEIPVQENTALSARKEELLASQIQMEQKIEQLQQNVQKAIAEQEKLNTQVVKLQKEIGSIDTTKSTTTTTTTTTYTPPVVKKPVTKPVVVNIPTPTPTTRAS